MFITFEGGEGAGKSTQSELLFSRLKEKTDKVVLTKEPCAEEIRNLLLTGDEDKWDPMSEALLYMAERADHWHNIIKPNLMEGKIVISDRFHDSTLAYQGYGRGVPISFLNIIYAQITQNRWPDITVLLMIDPEKGLQRSLARSGNSETRFEHMGLDFHKKVHEGFIKIPVGEQYSRFLVIDANKDEQSIADEIYERAQQLFT